MNYQLSQLKERFTKLRYKWPTTHLITIRSKKDAPNEFDDVFYFINGLELYKYTGTTNPGTSWLRNPMKSNGTAVVKPGQYIDAFQLGYHHGLYKALVQAKPVTVFRDNDKDDKSENNGVEETGMFNINIHRASDKWISKLIDKWSAGCMVFNNPAQFNQFLDIYIKSKEKFLTLTLLEEF